MSLSEVVIHHITSVATRQDGWAHLDRISLSDPSPRIDTTLWLQRLMTLENELPFMTSV